MRLTTKGRFAVTAMIDLALQQDTGPVSLAGISQRQNISLSYLEQLFSKLRRHELVESVRGPGGGYHIARALKEVSVADVILAVDEPLDATQCGGKENCTDEGQCKATFLFCSHFIQQVFKCLNAVNFFQCFTPLHLLHQQGGWQVALLPTRVFTV